MKLILKKFIIILLIICILISSLFSGFVLADEVPLTQERAGNYAASFAINFYDNWSSISFEVVDDDGYGSGYNSSVLEAAQKIFDSIWKREDVVYNDAGGKSSDLIVNHPEQITGIDCSAFVSAALWAAGYKDFERQHSTYLMVANCANGTYASYGLEIYKNDNGTTKKWNGSSFVEDLTLQNGIDFLRPGDAIVLNNRKKASYTDISRKDR